jgi:L-ascorbate metabolism protein UlaG (beta-lactamase superfamily)
MLSIHSLSSRFLVTAHGVATIAVIAIGALAASPASAQTDSKAALSSTKAVEITYVANEGFLISGAGRKILIDAIFSEGFGRFYTPAGEILTQETTAAPPFDHIDALLITHYHPDHINPAAVVQHLANDHDAVLIGPPQVNDLLKPIKGYEAIAKQVLVVSPGFGDATESSVRDIKIRSVALQHMSDAQKQHQNLGFLLSLGGFKLFHVGDAGVSEVAEYKNLKLTGENIDIAFLNHFWFDNENIGQAREIIGYLKPKAVILMHMDVGKADDYRNLIGPMGGLPPVYMAESPMETLRFRRVGGNLSADHTSLQDQVSSTPRPKP